MIQSGLATLPPPDHRHRCTFLPFQSLSAILLVASRLDLSSDTAQDVHAPKLEEAAAHTVERVVVGEDRTVVVASRHNTVVAVGVLPGIQDVLASENEVRDDRLDKADIQPAETAACGLEVHESAGNEVVGADLGCGLHGAGTPTETWNVHGHVLRDTSTSLPFLAQFSTHHTER